MFEQMQARQLRIIVVAELFLARQRAKVSMRSAFCSSVMMAVLGCGHTSQAPLHDPQTVLSREESSLSSRNRLSHSVTGRSSEDTVLAVSAPEFRAQFVDVHEASGVEFVYANGAIGRALMVEATGGGVGWLDYDNDGHPDLYFAQGGNPAWETAAENAPDALYRQVDGGQFVEVARLAGIDEGGYGQGVAVGDFDNDGFDDIYVTNVGKNSFFHNLGDGTFREIADAAGVQDARWSTSAAWADLDSDGDLDLFICNYVIYDPYHPYPCNKKDGTPTTCHPEELNPVPNVCFENLGNGSFTEVSKAWGLTGEGSKSLGVVVADLDGDRHSDIYVANDTTANFLYSRVRPGFFREEAAAKGCALSGDGLYQASMGIAIGDYDQNGYLDLYVTHFANDYNTLYANLGTAGFHDATQALGLHEPSLKYLAFGTVMADFDRNGEQDIFVANGHVDDWTATGSQFVMPAQMFTHQHRRFVECSEISGDYFREQVIGRGVAICDWDDDGDLDLVVVHQNRPAALLRNDCSSGHFLKVRLVGTSSNRRGINTKLVLRQGTRRMVQELVAGSSYCSTHDPCVYFGLTSGDDVSLQLWWPSGIEQTVDGITVDQTLILREPSPTESTPTADFGVISESRDP